MGKKACVIALYVILWDPEKEAERKAMEKWERKAVVKISQPPALILWQPSLRG